MFVFAIEQPSFAERKNLRIQGVKRQIVLLIIDLCVTLFIEIKPVVLPRCHALFPPPSLPVMLFILSIRVSKLLNSLRCFPASLLLS